MLVCMYTFVYVYLCADTMASIYKLIHAQTYTNTCIIYTRMCVCYCQCLYMHSDSSDHAINIKHEQVQTQE